MIYKLHWTDKDGNENILYVRKLKNLWYWVNDFSVKKASSLQVILGIAQAIRDKDDVVIHEDAIKELED